jgi:glutathione S-transferase
MFAALNTVEPPIVDRAMATLVVTVLRRLSGSGILEKYPNLSAYVARGETRRVIASAHAAARCWPSLRRDEIKTAQ